MHEPRSLTLNDLIEEGASRRAPGARPVVVLDPEDPEELWQEVRHLARREVTLQRRDRPHGTWFELEAPRATPSPEEFVECWNQGRPMVLARLLDPSPAGEGASWVRALATASGPLVADLPAGLAATGECAERPDPDRDLRRWTFSSQQVSAPLWAKLARLSTHAKDASLRVRVSAGRDPEDEASRDEACHQEVARLGAALLPGCAAIQRNPVLAQLLEGVLRGRPLLTQAIGYANAPNGGALFHHDAFDEPLEGGQRGVVYTQLEGTTAWLALSTEDLCHEVQVALRELLVDSIPSETPAPFPPEVQRSLLQCWAADPEQVSLELRLPGCGRLGALVNDGPWFTERLVAAGHAFLLEPGDAAILPNQGYGLTAYHSVFCSSEGPNWAVSQAVRRPGAPEPEPLPVVRIGKGTRRRRRRRRSGR